MSHSRDLDFLFEVGALRFKDRVWVQFHRPNVANVAEHTLRVAWIAQLLAAREGADVGKVLQMAMVHDVGKSRAGDAHWLNRAYIKRDESKAIADTTANTSVGPVSNELWKEFKAGGTIEAKIVKDADNLDVDLEFRERRDDWNFARREDHVRRNVFEHKLYTDSAKELWQEIQSSDPHRWYVEVYDELAKSGAVGATEN
jgi:putative hydrolase of HD superfamily